MIERDPLPCTGAPSLSRTTRDHSFAARWSASFAGSLAHAARALKVQLPRELFIDVAVEPGAGNNLLGRLNVSLPGVDRRAAREVLHAAHQTCPYWRLSPKNIDVVITLL